MKWLVRSSRDTICWCDCPDHEAVAGLPGGHQLDCPWCGCGYLFSCITCGKAFTYARCVELSLTAEDIVKREYERIFSRPCTPDKIAKYTPELRDAAKDLELDAEYVILDGKLLETTLVHAEFTGTYGRHRLHAPPQITFRGNKPKLTSMLDRSYWLEARKRKELACS